MAKFTFAIMGATGHIGHDLTEALLKKGHKVRALGRDAHKLQLLKNKGAETLSGDFTDTALLIKAFKGCDAVFSFLPGYNADDMEVFRDNIGEAIAHAVAKAKISHVINLSSIGANLSSSTGPIKALHRQEERLNALSNLKVLHFRPSYFMENLMSFLPNIKSSGTIASALKSDLAIPMVATCDIAHKIAEFMDVLEFAGQSVFEFVGPKAITMLEATKVIGKAIGKPDLKYVQLSHDEVEKAMFSSGMKHQVAKIMADMQIAFNQGLIVPTQKMTAEHKGKTSIEDFAKNIALAYRSQKKVA